MTVAPLIHIADGQSDEILGDIAQEYIIDDTHRQSLEDMLETFEFYTFGDKPFTQHLKDRNRIIIPDEDGSLREFIIYESEKYRDSEGYKMYVIGTASYIDLKKANVIRPGSFTGTASQHIGIALNDTEWRPGIVEVSGSRTIHRDNFTNPFDYLKTLAREFEGELRFRIEHNGNRITGRFVDLLERIGEWRGREIEFGKDLDGIRRIENTERIVTALIGLGPERDDGTRLEVFVEDTDALKRWGRPDPVTGELRHLIEVYEPQSERQEMTEEELRQYTRTELNKRINAVVTYECSVVDLENVPGMENKQIRFGDTIKIKDTKFNPPLYIEARVYEQERSIKSKAKKTIKLGDFVEYTEEEINVIWNQLRNEIRRRLDRMAIVTINSTAGNVFKNAQGETKLTARTFVNGAERDEDGTLYDYQWMRFDKDGNHDTDFYAEGKTITVKASDIDEKATYRVLVAYELEVINTAEITISNVFDGEDGEPGPPGPPGEDGKTFYTWIKYADTPTSGMSDSPEGKEYIGIAYNKETPTPSTNYSDYIWAKFKGEQGIPGPPGKDGQPTYTWVKYADDEHGNGMSDSPEGKLYIGLAFNKTTPQESNNPADYTWSLMPQNIEIGGRNLYKSSDNIPIINVESGITYQKISDGIYENVWKFTKADTSNANWIKINDSYLVNLLEPDKEFTVSIMAKGTPRTGFAPILRFYFNASTSYKNMSPQVGSNYTWVSFTFKASDVTPSMHIGMINFKELYIALIKIERGNKATDWTRAEEDVQEQIDEAKQEAEEAKQTAQQAQTTADGKNSVFHLPTAPPTAGRKIGDIWFDTSRDNLMHRFDGTSWVQAKWGERSLAAESVTALHIKSLEGLNVNDQFIVDSQGNVKFAGRLEGASGTFSGDIEGATITGSSFYAIDPDDEEHPNSIIISYSTFRRTFNNKTNKTTTETSIGDLFSISSYDYSGFYGPGTHLVGIVDLDHHGLRLFHRDFGNTEYGVNSITFEGILSSDEFTFFMNKARFTGSVEIGSFDTPLWTGVRYPTDASAQTVYPSKRLSNCMTGWILRWQHYVPGTGTENQQFQYTHIPKAHLQAGAAGIRVPLQRAGGTNVTKYIYVYDDRIEGHVANGESPNNTLALTGVFEY